MPDIVLRTLPAYRVSYQKSYCRETAYSLNTCMCTSKTCCTFLHSDISQDKRAYPDLRSMPNQEKPSLESEKELPDIVLRTLPAYLFLNKKDKKSPANSRAQKD